MRFFSGREWAEYPDDPIALREQIIRESLCTGHTGFRKALAFFTYYFDHAEARREHPILGDLNTLTNEIDARWDTERGGVNLVTGMIKFRLEEMQSEAPTASSTSSSSCW